MKKLITLALLSVCFVSGHACAQNAVTLQDLSKFQGIWKSAHKNPEGIDVVSYDMHRIDDEIGVMLSWHFAVDAESKEIVSWFRGFVKVDAKEQQYDGIYFSWDGWVGQTTMVPTESGFVTHVRVVNPDQTRVALTIEHKFESNTERTLTQRDIIVGGAYVPQIPVRQFSKIDARFRQLVEDGAIVFPEDIKPLEALAPLMRLAGRWKSDADGGPSHDLRWRSRVAGKWLIERYSITNNGEVTGAGFNISGVDPTTGQLALWQANRGGVGKHGRWDVLSGNALGQVQGNYRIVRKFNENGNEFVAQWQAPSSGNLC